MAALPTGVKIAEYTSYRAEGGWLEGTVTLATDDVSGDAELAKMIEALTPDQEWTLPKYDGIFSTVPALHSDLTVRFMDLPASLTFGAGGVPNPITLAWSQ